MVVSPRRYQRRLPVSILRLLLLFSVKRAPRNCRGFCIELSPFRELRIFRGRRCFRLEFWEGEGSAAIVSRDDLFEAGVAQLPFETRRDLMVRAASRRLDEPDTKRSSNRLM